MLTKAEVKYSDIFWIQFSPGVGHEFQDKRPAIVIQTNEQITRSNLLTVMPLTGKIHNKLADDIIIEPDQQNNLRRTSIVKVYNIESCDYQRVIGKIGVASEKVMIEIKQYLKIHFGFK